MTEKQQYALDKILAALPDDSRPAFEEVALCAIALGYMPALKGARESYADFTKSRTRRTILKIDTDPKFPPRLAIKYYALPAYEGLFSQSVESRVHVLERMGHTVHCWGCGRCDGTEGYLHTLSDGRSVFLCGNGLVDLPSLRAENVPEVKEALAVQDAYFMAQAGK